MRLPSNGICDCGVRLAPDVTQRIRLTGAFRERRLRWKVTSERIPVALRVLGLLRQGAELEFTDQAHTAHRDHPEVVVTSPASPGLALRSVESREDQSSAQARRLRGRGLAAVQLSAPGDSRRVRCVRH